MATGPPSAFPWASSLITRAWINRRLPHPNAATSSAASPGGSASDLRCVRYFFFWSKRCVRYFVCVLTAACAVGASRDHVTAIAERLLACYAVPWDAFGGKKKSSFKGIRLIIFIFVWYAARKLSLQGKKPMGTSSTSLISLQLTCLMTLRNTWRFLTHGRLQK